MMLSNPHIRHHIQLSVTMLLRTIHQTECKLFESEREHRCLQYTASGLVLEKKRLLDPDSAIESKYHCQEVPLA